MGTMLTVRLGCWRRSGFGVWGASWRCAIMRGRSGLERYLRCLASLFWSPLWWRTWSSVAAMRLPSVNGWLPVTKHAWDGAGLIAAVRLPRPGLHIDDVRDYCASLSKIPADWDALSCTYQLVFVSISRPGGGGEGRWL
mmetsp:Transcript_70760/g.162180  ORF Transcript_70760/g.162180 Transcript_70760/m.162180 type:complete len:139 (-) Transcript_70760:156-572(-)